MPFIPNTPESLLQRSDSKDPGTTCRGLTGAGKPCRRPAATSPPSSGPPSPNKSSAEDHYCWQHKDQAALESGNNNASPQGLQKSKIRERTSIDTLVDRLGLLEVESPTKATKPSKRRPHSSAPAVDFNSRMSEKPSLELAPKPPVKTWQFLCCFGTIDEEPAPRPTHSTGPKRKSSAVPTKPTPQNNKPKPSQNSAIRPEKPLPPLIPADVSPETAAKLQAELAKPVSALDEPGYIYIFWLTSEALPAAPPEETTSSLLTPPRDSSRPQHGRRRTSDVLQSYTTTTTPTPTSTDNKKPILLKIGRANNVQRRMNEWQRQCGYEVNLIRFYPHIHTHSASAASPSPSPTKSTSSSPSPRPSLNSTNIPRKVPNVHKVERLIHLELAGKRKDMGGKCGRCGKEHREWFEIEGSRAGLRGVDDVIQKWVKWAESGA